MELPAFGVLPATPEARATAGAANAEAALPTSSALWKDSTFYYLLTVQEFPSVATEAENAPLGRGEGLDNTNQIVNI